MFKLPFSEIGQHNEGSIIKARRFWVKGGWHPPDDDPRQSSLT